MIHQLQWKQVAHASYTDEQTGRKNYETVYKAEYKNYSLYRNGSQYQIEESGTEQTKWLNKEEFEKQFNLL